MPEQQVKIPEPLRLTAIYECEYANILRNGETTVGLVGPEDSYHITLRGSQKLLSHGDGAIQFQKGFSYEINIKEVVR